MSNHVSVLFSFTGCKECWVFFVGQKTSTFVHAVHEVQNLKYCSRLRRYKASNPCHLCFFHSCLNKDTLQCIVGRTCHRCCVDDDPSPTSTQLAHVLQSQVRPPDKTHLQRRIVMVDFGVDSRNLFYCPWILCHLLKAVLCAPNVVKWNRKLNVKPAKFNRQIIF